HEERHQRELADQLVRVVRHPSRTLPRLTCGSRWGKSCGSSGGGFGLEVLVARAVVAVRERRPLTRLALARRRAAPGDAAVERTRLDLLLDELLRRVDALRHGPRHVRLARDREVAPDVLEERAVGLREVERVGREPLHRLLARLENGTARLDLRVAVGVRLD